MVRESPTPAGRWVTVVEVVVLPPPLDIRLALIGIS